MRTSRAALTAWAEREGVELLFFEPGETFDAAIIGVVHGYGQEAAVLYDQEQVIAALTRDMAGDEEAAHEWFAFNTIGAYVGEATPRFLLRIEEEKRERVSAGDRGSPGGDPGSR